MADIKLDEKRALLCTTEDDFAKATELIDKYSINQEYIVINHKTFYTAGPKQWGLKYFQYLIDKIKKNSNKDIVVVGSATDPKLSNAININGEDLRAVALLISKSSLYIGLDSGITHIASCYNIPIISIHPSTNPKVTGALSNNITFIEGEKIDGINFTVPFDKVWQAVEEKL